MFVVDLTFRFVDANLEFLREIDVDLDDLRRCRMGDLWAFDPQDHADDFARVAIDGMCFIDV